MLNRLFGAYCDIKPLSNATITAALQGLGSKEHGKLPTKPVSHIPESKENQSTKPTVKKDGASTSVQGDTLKNRLTKLKELEDAGLISKEDAAAKRKEILGEL